jgi:hypothetical protein
MPKATTRARVVDDDINRGVLLVEFFLRDLADPEYRA